MTISLFPTLWLRRSPVALERSLPLGPRDVLTMNELYEGCLILGGTGSGKTTGPAEAVMRFLLNEGCGVLWLTAKADEYDRAERLCRQTNRSRDLIRFAPDESHTFNFLEYELTSRGAGTASAAQLLDDLVSFASRSSGQGSDPFWPMAASRLLRMSLSICNDARRPCTIEHLYSFLTNLPTKDSLGDSRWRDGFCAKSIGLASGRTPRSQDFDLAASYLLEEWPSLADRTASSIHAQAMNVVDRFMAGGLTSLVASDRSTLTPNDLHAGKVIVLDVPYLRYREPGQFVQLVWKLAAIRATLRREVTSDTRPVAIFADEAQLFCLPRIDAATQAVGRSSRLISVAATQNLPLAISALGGPGMEKEALAWFANFSTQIFCANSDGETNEYASARCGKSRHFFYSGSATQEPFDLAKEVLGQGMKSTASFNQQWFPDLPPEVFASQLRRGGAGHGFFVDGVVTRTGRRFSNGKPFLITPFKQEVGP